MKGRRKRGWSSGEAHSWPAPSARCSPRLPTTEEEILVAECDPRHIEEVRRNWPFLRDRRIDAYGPICSRILD